IADGTKAKGRVVAGWDAYRHRQFVAAEVERAKDDVAAFHGPQGGNRVLVLLFLRRQRRALEVQELGAEKPDGIGPQLDRDRQFLQQLDVGSQLDANVVEGSRWSFARFGESLGLHQVASRAVGEALLHAEVGLEDDFAPTAVDDD